MTIADMSSINVEVKVDETAIDKVEVGQKAKIKVDAFGDKELEGEVLQKTPLAVGKSQTSGGLSTNINVQEAKEFRVVIELEDLPQEIKDGLRPGMSATADDHDKDGRQRDRRSAPGRYREESRRRHRRRLSRATFNRSPADKPKLITGVYVLDGNKAKFVEVDDGHHRRIRSSDTYGPRATGKRS